jgi:serine/threonine-protein kinase
MEKKLLGGRYRIDALIGRGGMSDVYRGMDVVLQRQVAIKILTDRSEDLRKRFLREAQSMARPTTRTSSACTTQRKTTASPTS